MDTLNVWVVGANCGWPISILFGIILRMKCYHEVCCPACGNNEIKKAGFSQSGEQRYECYNLDCGTRTFMLKYRYKACEHGIRKQLINMAINSSGIRDTVRVLGIDKNTVIRTIRSKQESIVHVNPNFLPENTDSIEVRLELADLEAEVDEQWSFVAKKSNPRWLWYAVEHSTNTVLSFAFGPRKDDIFKQLQERLSVFNISRFYTDDWGAYTRNLMPENHQIGKQNTQKIERKNLNWRTWIKRLARKSICFSKLECMHDTVIGLLINKVEFGLDIHA